jgi:hypothetical protein
VCCRKVIATAANVSRHSFSVSKANLTKPVIHPNVWQEIPDQQVRPAISPTNEEQD